MYLFFLIPSSNFAIPSNSDPCLDLISGGLISGSQTIIAGETASTIWNILAPSSLTNSTDIEYQWMISTTDPYDFSTYSPIPGATNRDLNPGVLGRDSYFLRCARRAGCDNFPIESNLVTVEVLGLLAVELENFSLKISNQFNVSLSWETSSEYNHKHFELERSTDGREFMPIGIIEGLGTTLEGNQYFYNDRLPTRDTYYYRLKSVEFGGLIEYSRTLKIDNLIGKDITTKIFPNPSADYVNIDFEQSFTRDLTIELYNSNMELVEKFQLLTGDQQLTFNMEERENGFYFIKIPTEQGYSFKRILRVGSY